MTSRTKIAASVATLVVVGVALFFLVGPGKDIRNLWSKGVIQSAMNDPGEDRKYSASRQSNLKAIYIALNLYEDSEGQYPAASGWMDAIKPRLRTTDMNEQEAAKKLVRPNLQGGQADQYGYEINDSVAGHYKGDIKNPKTPLVFESSDLQKNAHGDPMTQKGEFAIAMDGTIIKL